MTALPDTVRFPPTSSPPCVAVLPIMATLPRTVASDWAVTFPETVRVEFNSVAPSEIRNPDDFTPELDICRAEDVPSPSSTVVNVAFTPLSLSVLRSSLYEPATERLDKSATVPSSGYVVGPDIPVVADGFPIDVKGFPRL